MLDPVTLLATATAVFQGIKNTSDAIFISVVVGIGSIIMFHIVEFMLDRWPE